MTGLMRGVGIGFPQIEFMVCSQSSSQYPVTSNSTPGPQKYSERAQARAGGAAVAAGLGRFAGEMRRDRQQSGSRSLPQGEGLRQRWERREILHVLGILSLADHERDVDVFEDLTGSD